MIALGVSHQTLHKVLGHYFISYITKFPNGRSDNFFITKKIMKTFE